MSDVGKMIHSCSDKQATVKRPFQDRAPSPCGIGLPSEEAVLCPAANVERQMLHKKLFFDGDKDANKYPELQMHQTQQSASIAETFTDNLLVWMETKGFPELPCF